MQKSGVTLCYTTICFRQRLWNAGGGGNKYRRRGPASGYLPEIYHQSAALCPCFEL